MNLKKISKQCRQNLLNLCYTTRNVHIGSALSCVDLLVTLYFKELKENDIFILSKGHAAAALYTVLSEKGLLDKELLKTFCKEGTLLAAHPAFGGTIPAIPFGTGSLGHGLALGNGLALSQKFTKKNFKVYCLLSDGDCNEGATWEAALFSTQHRLQKLYVVIDQNNLQGLGDSKKILNLEPLREKWLSFGFEVQCVDGHNFNEIQIAFEKFKEPDTPKCLIARTIKGKGVSFMENQFEWHYLSMTETQYHLAVKEVLQSET